jgi:hypothetical protein
VRCLTSQDAELPLQPSITQWHHVVLQVRDLLVPLVQPWVPLICGVLATDPAARPTWPVKLGALRLGLSITSYFSKPLAAAMPHLMSATWQLLLALQVRWGVQLACNVGSWTVCAASNKLRL